MAFLGNPLKQSFDSEFIEEIPVENFKGILGEISDGFVPRRTSIANPGGGSEETHRNIKELLEDFMSEYLDEFL